MKEVINLLQIKEAMKIGSSKDPRVRFASDIDLQEFINVGSYDDILQKFQQKFRLAKRSKNIWITDFKCGIDVNNIPYRWSYDDIMNGYQIHNNEKIYFIDQFKKQSIIKLDVVALIHGQLIEFSNNYYFTIGNYTTQPYKSNEIKKSLILDAIEYQQADMYFKSLKRLFSFYKLINNRSEQAKLLKIFNSNIGKLYSCVNDLNIVLLMLDQQFRHISLSILIKFIKSTIKRKLEPKYHYLINEIIENQNNMPQYIEAAKQMINNEVNQLLFKYLEQHKINISPVNVYNQFND
jgi:hypothetical protein